MANILYTLIIYPLTLIIETSYMLVSELFGNTGVSVIGVSMAVSFLCLPLYVVAEKWQDIERKKQKEMEGGIARIKKAFKGDEQYMMLTTFYKENHYHPLMALRSSFGLLIQVPFFMAAYTFLSSMPALQGQSFAFIRDMGKPDAIFCIGAFPVNVLPIAMTLINIAGSAVYTKGFKLKEKLPIYAMALIFLVLLYDSPAGLVLYWTMNNIFSLAKNVFYKIKRPLLALYVLACAAAAAGILYVLTAHNGLFSKRLVMAAFLSLVFFAPLFVKAASWAVEKPLKKLAQNKGERHAVFLLSALSLSLLTGLVIPSYIISSSVLEFVNIDKIADPTFYVANALLQSAGLFFFWFCCVYFLFGNRVQSAAAFLASLLLLWAALNSFVFGGDYGNLSRVLIFDKSLADTALQKFLNAAVLALAAAALLASFRFFKSEKFVIPLCATALMAFLTIGAINTAKIHSEAKKYSARQVQEEDSIKPAFHFSKKGKNVVVIMADRASNGCARTIFETFPDLKEAFGGWTLYSHTLSYDSHTLLGAPPLYGGYEYTPLEMNKRDDVPLKQKNNEALLLMPRVFTEQAGFGAQAVDLSWANYCWIPDMSICDPYPKIAPFNLEGKYTSKWIGEHPKNVRPNAASETIKRNFLWFSLFKESPMFLRESVYDDGAWWSSDKAAADIVEYISRYSPLDYLPQLTAFDGNDKGNFVLLQTMATHSSVELQAPDYVPSLTITDKGPFAGDPNNPIISSNVAMYKCVSRWTRFLKENGCYDNTRIIIVADHGVGMFNPKERFFYGGEDSNILKLKGATDESLLPVLKELASSIKDGYSLDHNHPLLIVKDFSDGKKSGTQSINVDDSFMTNADTPYLAFEGIIPKPVNPWTGKEITRRTESAARGVVAGGRYDPGKNGVYKFDLKGIKTYDVYDDMANNQNWKERKE